MVFPLAHTNGYMRFREMGEHRTQAPNLGRHCYLLAVANVQR